MLFCFRHWKQRFWFRFLANALLFPQCMGSKYPNVFLARLDLMILTGHNFWLCISSVSTGPNVHYTLWSQPWTSPLANVRSNRTGLEARSFVCSCFSRKLKNFLYFIFYFVPSRQAQGKHDPFVLKQAKTSVCLLIILFPKCQVWSCCY